MYTITHDYFVGGSSSVLAIRLLHPGQKQKRTPTKTMNAC